MTIDSLLVVGSGTMGRGIAQVAATAGLKTFLFDAIPAQLKGAAEQIERDLKRLVDKGKLTADVAGSAKTNLTIADSLDRIAWPPVGLVIEAIYEDFEAKKSLYGQIEPRLTAAAILASNT